MRRLRCVSQSYAWGNVGPASVVYQLQTASSSKILDATQPYAELWMGTHPSGPSRLVQDEKHDDLLSYISQHTDFLGQKSLSKFGKNLSFLFKVLSVGKALSIQAHPDKLMAEKLHTERPDIYKDGNHKPELAIALTDFEALLSFRPLSEIVAFYEGLPELRDILGDDVLKLISTDEKSTIKYLYSRLMNSSAEKVCVAAKAFAGRIKTGKLNVNLNKLPANVDLAELGSLFCRLNSQFPGDVGCFSIFFFNYLKLKPGEAIFLAANLPHAYISGDCVECMANSDNVVRAGLTPKFKDTSCLLRMLDYTPMAASRVRFSPVSQPLTDKKGSLVTATLDSFIPSVDDFAVDRITITQGNSSFKIPPVSSASIFIFISGSGTISCENGSSSSAELSSFGRGSVFFVPSDAIVLIQVDGDFGSLVFRAFCNIS